MQILKDLSIAVPAKNESKNLEFILPILKRYSEDIIVVDGHSNDGTKELCKKFNIKFLSTADHTRSDTFVLNNLSDMLEESPGTI